jgi:hypothetical protein
VRKELNIEEPSESPSPTKKKDKDKKKKRKHRYVLVWGDICADGRGNIARALRR